MREFDEIWAFVENKLKTSVPPYFKNILKACGYNNGITISLIEPEDIEYFENEVKNRNVSQFFKGKEDTLLEGCTRNIDDFEFPRGHKKFLMSIVDSLKKHLRENGPDSFVLKLAPKKLDVKPYKTKVLQQKLAFPSRKRKFFEVDPLIESAMATMEMSNEESALGLSSEDILNHKTIILNKIVAGLRHTTKKKFSQNIESIKKKISSDLLKLNIKNSKNKESEEESKEKSGVALILEGVVRCPYCAITTNVFHTPNQNNYFLWNTSNFDRHLRLIHTNKIENIETRATKSTMEERQQETNSPTITYCTVTSNEIQLDKVAEKPLKVFKILDETNDCIQYDLPLNNMNLTNNIETLPTVKKHCTITETITSISKPKMENAAEKLIRSEFFNKSNPRTILSYFVTSDESEKEQKSVDLPLKAKRNKIDSTLFETESKHDLKEANGLRKNEVRIVSEMSNCSPAIDLCNEAFYQEIPVLQNGYESRDGRRTIITGNTCAFDSIFSILTCFYIDDLNIRAHIDSSQSKFSQLIKTFVDIIYSTSESEAYALKNVYADRNMILKELYCNECSNSFSEYGDCICINCDTGIGNLYGRLCLEMEESIASAVRESTCNYCQTTKTNVLPFLPCLPNITLHSIQKSIDFSCLYRFCRTCKNSVETKKCYNNILILEAEPHSNMQLHKKISLKNLSQKIHVDTRDYDLRGVINHDPNLKHFTALVRRINDEWKCYDDMKCCELKTENSMEIIPFLLFYVSVDHDFNNTSQSVKQLDEGWRKYF